MMMTLPEMDKIYFSKTKTYFKEVLSSYSNGNFRSATVMLYSIAICDILFKLQELRDVYNDSVAIEILDSVEKTQTSSKSKSSWEKVLIDEVRQKTQLLEIQAYSNLIHLYDDRNLSAHPAMTQDYELISPSQETTIAHIKNILNEILIKPPIFIKSIMEVLLEDLKQNANMYSDDTLTIYLRNKYFSKMTETMKIKVFKAFWKFCFKMSDNPDCMENLMSNRRGLNVLVSENPNLFAKVIREDSSYFTVDNSDDAKFALVALLSSFPCLYLTLDETVKSVMDDYINQEINAFFGAWFKFDSLQQHLEALKKLAKTHSLRIALSTSNYVIRKYKNEGYLKELIDFFINIFGDSYNYDCADHRYETFIRPILNNMSSEQFQLLISLVSKNRQIHGRNAAFSTNTEIASYATKVLPDGFKFSDYENFKFDESIIEAKTTAKGKKFDVN